MIKRMITRLIIAQLIPVAINAGKKAFRKKKPAVDANRQAADATLTHNANVDDNIVD